MKVPDIENWKRKYYRQVCAGGIWCIVSAGISIKVDVRLKNVTACSYTKSTYTNQLQLYVIYLRFKSKFLYKVYNKVQKVNTQQMSNLFTHQTIKHMTDTNYYKTMYTLIYTHTQINNTTEWAKHIYIYTNYYNYY